MAMMDTTVRLMLSVALMTGFLTSGYALAPNITSVGNKEQIIINSGDDIDLSCESSWPINWTIPYIEDTMLEVNNSVKEKPKFRHVSRLYLPNAQHYHTGFYKCYDENNITREDSIYIYVKNESYPFVQKDVLIYLPVQQYQTAVFDCRPNAPDIVVQLQTATGDMLALGENSEDGTKLEYDPKIGFTMHFVNNKQGGLYNCIADEQELMFLLQIMPHSDSVAKPKITSNSEPNPAVGDDLILTCTVSVDYGITFSIEWDIPSTSTANEEGRVVKGPSSSYSEEKLGRFTRTGVRNLTVTNITKGDEGPYVCKVEDHAGNKNNNTKYINVHANIHST